MRHPLPFFLLTSKVTSTQANETLTSLAKHLFTSRNVGFPIKIDRWMSTLTVGIPWALMRALCTLSE